MELVFLPFALLIAVPGLAFVPALLLTAWVGRRWSRLGRGRRFVAGSAVLFWLVYAGYETAMWFWMRTVVAPIRVDLLLLVPLLVAALVAAVAACWGRGRGRGRDPGADSAAPVQPWSRPGPDRSLGDR